MAIVYGHIREKTDLSIPKRPQSSSISIRRSSPPHKRARPFNTTIGCISDHRKPRVPIWYTYVTRASSHDTKNRLKRPFYATQKHSHTHITWVQKTRWKRNTFNCNIIELCDTYMAVLYVTHYRNNKVLLEHPGVSLLFQRTTKHNLLQSHPAGSTWMDNVTWNICASDYSLEASVTSQLILARCVLMTNNACEQGIRT